MTPDREVPIGALLALGLQEQEAQHLCDNKPTVLWHRLARVDGNLAISVLTDEEFDLVRQELARAGLPGAHERTRQEAVGYVLLLAGELCPEGPWYSVDLHSAVACAILLGLVQQAWGFDEQQVKQRELENFGKLLGVAANVEAI